MRAPSPAQVRVCADAGASAVFTEPVPPAEPVRQVLQAVRQSAGR